MNFLLAGLLGIGGTFGFWLLEFADIPRDTNFKVNYQLMPFGRDCVNHDAAFDRAIVDMQQNAPKVNTQRQRAKCKTNVTCYSVNTLWFVNDMAFLIFLNNCHENEPSHAFSS